MASSARYSSDVTFTPAVKAIQSRKGSRPAHARIARLMPAHHGAKAEQVIVFSVTAWDSNCPQHIPVRWDAVSVQVALDQREQRIQVLEAQLAKLQSADGAA